MNRRLLKGTNNKVSEIGLGTWQLGNNNSWYGPTPEESINIIKKAYEKGCNFFDTAPNYANGNSERLLGETIATLGVREQVVINSKFGHWSDGSIDFDANKLEKSIDESLSRLQTDYLDSVILHNPSFEILEGKTGHFKQLEQLKKKDKIKFYGVSVDSSDEMITVMNNTDIQVIEVMFNILYQEPKKAFDLAQKNNVNIIVKVPLDSGWLTGKYDENSTFDDIRNRWSNEDKEFRARMIKEIKKIIGEDDMIHQALQFILSFDEITTVIPGAKNIQQLEHNLAASEKQLSPQRKRNFVNLYKDNIRDQNYSW